MSVAPEQVYTTSSQVLTPQQGFQAKITIEGTINVYLLEVGSEDPYAERGMLFANAAELQEFLEANPNLKIWEYNLEDGYFERYYAPTKVMNATLVFYNPTSDSASVVFEVTLTSSIAPGEKVLNIALWTTPIGLILAIPWLANLWKQRKQSKNHIAILRCFQLAQQSILWQKIYSTTIILL